VLQQVDVATAIKSLAPLTEDAQGVFFIDWKAPLTTETNLNDVVKGHDRSLLLAETSGESLSIGVLRPGNASWSCTIYVSALQPTLAHLQQHISLAIEQGATSIQAFYPHGLLAEVESALGTSKAIGPEVANESLILDGRTGASGAQR